MNIDQVYDELYGVIDRNKAADAATQGKVAALEGTVTTQGETIAALQTVIPEVPGRQLKLVDLGTEYTQELKEDIYSGAFEKAIVGGYLTINSHVYILAHPDYWLHKGNAETTAHHMLVIPAGNLGTGAMNLTNIITGGYQNSDMRAGHEDTTDPSAPVHVDGALQAVIDIIEEDFGAENILSHKEIFTNHTDTNAADGWSWVDSEVDLMNEIMVFGSTINASSVNYECGIDNTQIKSFAERPDLTTFRSDWWLRCIASEGKFCKVANNGVASKDNATAVLGIRPVFAIKGAPPETRTRKRKG